MRVYYWIYSLGPFWGHSFLTHTHIYIHIYIYIYTHTQIYIYIHIYIHNIHIEFLCNLMYTCAHICDHMPAFQLDKTLN